jgi:hypothetical protein
MSRDPEIAAKTRFALWVLGLVGFTDVAVLANVVTRWIGTGHWQYGVMSGLFGLLAVVVAVCAVQVRRGSIVGRSSGSTRCCSWWSSPTRCCCKRRST